MEKPILFNTEMVKAILEGRKTQTRRAIKNIKVFYSDGIPANKPPYKTGDVLYVRETWATILNEYVYKYGYDDEAGSIQDGYKLIEPKWKPSIHMPREAARLFLKVKDVRVERLRDMNDSDLASEGFGDWVRFISLWNSTIKSTDCDKYDWNANPWVWVIEFERCEKPEGWLQ